MTATIKLRPADDVCMRRPDQSDATGNVFVNASMTQGAKEAFIAIHGGHRECPDQDAHVWITLAQAREIGQALLDAAGPEAKPEPRFEARIDHGSRGWAVWVNSRAGGDIWFHDTAQTVEKLGQCLTIKEARAIADALYAAVRDQMHREAS